jgi:hypothetical protein
LTDAEIRHNLEVPESAFGAAEGYQYRPCEERSDEAIQTFLARWIASLRSQ